MPGGGRGAQGGASGPNRTATARGRAPAATRGPFCGRRGGALLGWSTIPESAAYAAMTTFSIPVLA